MAIDTGQKSPSDGKVWGIFKLPFGITLCLGISKFRHLKPFVLNAFSIDWI
ncbi:hypothetical protein ES332_D10G215600v1 [Gossypium tomentosum]|uniref:Uncharacterized protein n=1 Tax=Gossypium tomentosum TaxID=34277 RepID=A0A5D2J791_GOSTO|nr:hypothetical protein ES332_D10G215600v1 [Gossypium tomentosum]